MEDSEISVFICEDAKASKEIIERYFGEGNKVTYAAIFPKSQRKDIVWALDGIQEKE